MSGSQGCPQYELCVCRISPTLTKFGISYMNQFKFRLLALLPVNPALAYQQLRDPPILNLVIATTTRLQLFDYRNNQTLAETTSCTIPTSSSAVMISEN